MLPLWIIVNGIIPILWIVNSKLFTRIMKGIHCRNRGHRGFSHKKKTIYSITNKYESEKIDMEDSYRKYILVSFYKKPKDFKRKMN